MSGLRPSKRRSYRRPRDVVASVSLTSMMDMFTILVLFLLKSYSAEGTLLTLPADLHLPYSNSSQTPRVAVQVLLTATTLMVDGEPVAVDLQEAQDSQEMVLPALDERLNLLATQYQAIADRNPDVTFTGDIIIEADKDIPFRLLKKVLYTAGQAGFINQSLAVFQRGS